MDKFMGSAGACKFRSRLLRWNRWRNFYFTRNGSWWIRKIRLLLKANLQIIAKPNFYEKVSVSIAIPVCTQFSRCQLYQGRSRRSCRSTGTPGSCRSGWHSWSRWPCRPHWSSGSCWSCRSPGSCRYCKCDLFTLVQFDQLA